MASVTQTIPQFSLGMSEQPDNLKFPGQVTEIVNAIPDVTKGLFKRPGAKRIGTDALTSVQSGGSWFHYFRDETEGSYVGQVASDGQVRVWRCKDGQLMTTAYGTGGQTAIQNYLKTDIAATYTRSGTTITITSSNHGMSTGDSITADFTGGATDGTYTITSTGTNTFTVTDSASGTISTNNLTYVKQDAHKDLQFLTINDTTFVNSRNTDNPNTVVKETFAATYSQSQNSTTVTITHTDHGLAIGDNVNVDYTSGTAVDGDFLVQTVADSNTFTLTAAAAAGSSTSGNVTVKPLTDTTPDKHFALLELLRTENGRQYGIDVHSAASAAQTEVTRVTRLKVVGDNLYRRGGSGECPAIGTEVYSVTAASSYTGTSTVSVVDSSSNALTNTSRTGTLTSGVGEAGPPKNLIFRITTLGQQGVNEASSTINSGQDYIAAYSIEVKLLHGGEGWKEGDEIEVESTISKGGTTGVGGSVGSVAYAAATKSTPARYTLKVEKVETTIVNGTVSSNGDGVIRPEPTPFDGQTAVTADTVLGGIISELPTGISAQQIGTGLYLSSTSAFSVSVVEQDLMRVMQSSVNDVQGLPNQCKHGYIVKVANALRNEEDDYYLRFEGQNNKDGTGTWVECAKPSISKRLTNMPIVIQRTAATTFTVEQFTYDERDVGDEFINPMPSFLDKRINKVLFFRNRLAFLSGENVVTSRPGTLGRPDFFIETALTVSTADPVDISAASMFPSDLFDGIEINAGLLVFSTNQQFLLASDDTVFNPDTAKLRSVSTFNYNENMSPISLGTTVAYIDNSGRFSRFNEMANTGREAEPNIVEVSKVVPTLLPNDIDLITNSRENSIVIIGKTGTDEVFGYKYFQTAEKRQQAAWFKWKFNNPLIYNFIINDEYFFIDSDYYLQSIKLVQTEDDPSITKNDVDFLLHLDNHTTISGGSFNSTTNTTTFSGVGWLNTVTTPNHELVVIDKGSTPNDAGRYGKCTVSGTSFTVPGNWQGVTLTIGYLYPYSVKIPTIYPSRSTGSGISTDVNSSLVLHRIKFHFGKIGLYETTLERVGKQDYKEVYESTNMNIYKASRAPYLEEHIQTVPVYEKNTNVEITLKSSHPAPATLRALSWEGDYSPKYYRRA